MNDGNAEFVGQSRCESVVSLSKNDEVALRRGNGARGNIHQGRLTRTVFAKKCVNFPGLDQQAYICQGGHARVVLGDPT